MLMAMTGRRIRMTIKDLHDFFNSFLKIEDFPADPSMNGIQIQNSAPDTKPIKKVAFAVDACEQTALLAAESGASALVVHHGLFWGHCQTLTGSHFRRVSAFLKNDLALLAYHIPLDANNPCGNNFSLAAKLGLSDTERFGTWHGMTIGVKGVLPSSLSADELKDRVAEITKADCRAFCFDREKIRTVGIISGGAGEDVNQAVEQNLDAYITGEFAHEQYHFARESEINVIAGGHYGTEILGVMQLKEKVERELGLQTIFIDVPTNL